MVVAGTTSVFRPDGGGVDDRDGRRSRWCSPRMSKMRAGDRRASKGLSSVKCGSVAAKRSGSGKFLLVGTVLAIQFVGAAAISKAGSDIKVEFSMPEEAMVGASIELKCEWRILGENGLYSVKWYKDDHEFFRYLPDSTQRTQIFPRPGVKVEARPNSEQKLIKLRDLALESSGQYKCEVSTEAPSFATTYKMANLTVILPPEKSPAIIGLSAQYSVGENVTANCTAWPSVPKANLRWTINGAEVSPENIVQHPPLQPMNTGGIPNNLGLRFAAEPRHFVKNGDHEIIKIKCIAEVGSKVYYDTREVTKAFANNQRLSAGGDIHAAARSIRAGLLAPLLTAILALVLLTT